VTEVSVNEGDPRDPIVVFTTGGTIDKNYFDALSQYQIEGTVVSRLLQVAGVTHPYHLIEVLHKDSIDMTDEDRALLVKHIREVKYGRVVITHGTDTMDKTALTIAAHTDKTVVLTGALSPARFIESDAAFNLGMAFATAQVASPGVYIAMNGTVFPGDEAVKDRQRGFLRKPSPATGHSPAK